MRHRLYKYFTERKWADAFLDGEMLFRSLAYFRDYEDENVRGDRNEGNAIFRPSGGLIINNQTQRTTFTLPEFAFESKANQEEILVFCVSRSLTDELRDRFEAVACVEILRVPTLCERLWRSLPPNATRYARRVEYYDEGDGAGTRWALPDQIATSKFKGYKWQNEFRFVFSLTDALGFEKGTSRLVRGETLEPPKPAEHHEHLVKTGSLRGICHLHEL
jgi:hypothetical protein